LAGNKILSTVDKAMKAGGLPPPQKQNLCWHTSKHQLRVIFGRHDVPCTLPNIYRYAQHTGADVLYHITTDTYLLSYNTDVSELDGTFERVYTLHKKIESACKDGGSQCDGPSYDESSCPSSPCDPRGVEQLQGIAEPDKSHGQLRSETPNPHGMQFSASYGGGHND